jgi:hypothetical protein
MTTLVAGWGYIAENEAIADWARRGGRSARRGLELLV